MSIAEGKKFDMSYIISAKEIIALYLKKRLSCVRIYFPNRYSKKHTNTNT